MTHCNKIAPLYRQVCYDYDEANSPYTVYLGSLLQKTLCFPVQKLTWITGNTEISYRTCGWYGHHGSTAALIAVGSHNTDSVYHIVGYSDWNTCSTGGDWIEAWTDSDGVVEWSPTIILWGLPLHCEGHTVSTILLKSVGRSSGGRRKSWGWG